MNKLLIILFFLSIQARAQDTTRLLGMSFQTTGASTTVAFKYAGTPAAAAPVYTGDILISVNGQSVEGMTLVEAVQTIRRQPEQIVRLAFKRDGIISEFDFERVSQTEILQRIRAYIKATITSKLSLPRNIPVVTNWGYGYEQGGVTIYSDEIEFLPGGFMKKKTEMNTKGGGMELYEVPTYELLDGNYNQLLKWQDFSELHFVGLSTAGKPYFMAETVSKTSTGGEKIWVINEDGKNIMDAYADGWRYGRPNQRLEYLGHDVFAALTKTNPARWQLFTPNGTLMSKKDYAGLGYWGGPGALVKKGDSWEPVVIDGFNVGEDEGPWEYKDPENRLYYYANAKGKKINKEGFDIAKPFSEGLAAVKVGELFGFINRTGQWIIKPQFVDVYSFHGGLAPVKKYGEDWIFINTKGHQAIPGKFYDAKDFDPSGSYAYVKRDRDQTHIIDQAGNTLFEVPDANLYGIYHVAPGVMRVQLKDYSYFLDITSKPYRNYNIALGKQENPNLKKLASERDASKRAQEQDWARYKAQEQARWEQRSAANSNSSASATSGVATHKTCSKCNGEGYIIYAPGKNIAGTTYIDHPTKWIDKYGVERKNYYTLKCSICKGKGLVPN